MKKLNLKELGKRCLVALIAIPILFLIILIGKIPFLILVNLILGLALWEFYLLAEKKGFFPSKILGIVSILAIGWDVYHNHGGTIAPLLFLIIFCCLIIELFKGKKNPIANASITLFGVFYLSLLSSLLFIREFFAQTSPDYPIGGWLIIFVFLTIWICDTGAYILGSKYGRHPLFKRVSPNKSWEGAIGGFIIGIISAIGLRFLFLQSITMLDSIVVGTIVGIAGQMSDLIESLFKRDADVKDTSNILPGHGGILDRFDSPILVGPLVYIYFYFTSILS